MHLIHGSLTLDAWGNGYGSEGADFIVGGSENDAVYGGGGADLLVGGAGNDLLDGGDGDDRIVGGPGNDTLRGGLGRDTLDYGGLEHAVDVNLRFRSAHADGFDRVSGFENVIGTRFSDILRGDARDNRLSGGAGDDLLEGGEGRDTVIYYDAPGAVTVDLAAYLAVGHGRDGLVDIESVVGSRFDDVLRGNTGANWLCGREGDDLLVGGGGLDVASFAYAARGVTVSFDETFDGHATGEGLDTLRDIWKVVGSTHDDVLYTGGWCSAAAGGDGDDKLYGSHGGAVLLEGGDGDDLLAGSPGDDLLVGGAGADVFVGSGGVDEIRDFVPGLDRVDLRPYFVRDAAGTLGFLTDTPGGCVLDLYDVDHIVFTGVAAASLRASDFIVG